MARPKKYKQEPFQENEAPEIDKSEGGLIITSPVVKEEDEDFNMTGEMYSEESLPTVNSNISNDAMATPASALIAIGRLYNDAGLVSLALSHHLPKVAGEPELFSFLQRMQNSIGEFIHTIEQVEQGASESLLDAIESAVA